MQEWTVLEATLDGPLLWRGRSECFFFCHFTKMLKKQILIVAIYVVIQLTVVMVANTQQHVTNQATANYSRHSRCTGPPKNLLFSITLHLINIKRRGVHITFLCKYMNNILINILILIITFLYVATKGCFNLLVFARIWNSPFQQLTVFGPNDYVNIVRFTREYLDTSAGYKLGRTYQSSRNSSIIDFFSIFSRLVTQQSVKRCGYKGVKYCMLHPFFILLCINYACLGLFFSITSSQRSFSLLIYIQNHKFIHFKTFYQKKKL